MSGCIITNVSTYKAIAVEAYESMQALIESGRRPKEDGSPGWIVQFDPAQRSFKQAMIVIVFTGMWLEALLHLLIVRKHGEEKFQELDRGRKPYKERLQLIGVSEPLVLDSAERFRKARRELVHEKAYFDSGEIRTAQDEAHNAHELLLAIDSLFVKKVQ